MKIDNLYLLMPKRDIMQISLPKGYKTRRPLYQGDETATKPMQSLPAIL